MFSFLFFLCTAGCSVTAVLCHHAVFSFRRLMRSGSHNNQMININAFHTGVIIQGEPHRRGGITQWLSSFYHTFEIIRAKTLLELLINQFVNWQKINQQLFLYSFNHQTFSASSFSPVRICCSSLSDVKLNAFGFWTVGQTKWARKLWWWSK